MSGQIETYRDEIFNFLRTVTIKFEPFAYSLGEEYMFEHGVTDPHGAWNPYYINLSGEYAPNDERMVVYSPEEERTIPFDKENMKKYPKTSSIYRLPNVEYKALEEKYPKNSSLIRTIVYPPQMSIQEIIDAPNLSLLAYDDSLLEPQERDDLVSTLKNYLNMVAKRWWVPEFGYEDMYAVTFWAMLWQQLPLILLTRRFQNIKTNRVHSFHIWEYLKSHGLADYRDVLSLNQSLWLYRNIDYILLNRGKEHNLHFIAENLLGDVFVSLLYKDMEQETASRWDSQGITTPDFISYNYVNDKQEKVESFNTLNKRLIDYDLEYRDTAEYLEKTETDLALHNYHKLPTKFLEFKKNAINTSKEDLMVKVFLDNLFYRLSVGDISFTIKLKNRFSAAVVELTVSDAVLLWHYACHRLFELKPVMPNRAAITLALKKEKVLSTEFPDLIYAGHSRPLDSILDVKYMTNMLSWYKYDYSDQTKFMQDLVTNLRAIFAFNRDIDNSNHLPYHLAMAVFQNTIFVNEVVPIKFFDGTYEMWRQATPAADAILTAYENEHKSSIYLQLSQDIFDAIFPLDTSTADEFLGSLRGMEIIYAAIRDLFIRLCSYNVTYLETERDIHEYVHFDDVDTYGLKDTLYEMHSNWSLTYEELKNNYHTTYTPRPWKLNKELTTSQTNTSTTTENHIDVGFNPIDNHTVIQHSKFGVDPDISIAKHYTQCYRFTIDD